MRFWIREVMGWLLVGLGLFAFYMCLVLLFNHSVIEVGPLFVIGVVVFRGGIHLLKVAVAARICMDAMEKMDSSSAMKSKTRAKPRLPRTTLAKAGMSRSYASQGELER